MRFLLATLLLGGLWLMAAPAPTAADLQTRIDQLGKQLQAQNELLIVKTEGKVESVEKQMARQDERIRDMDQSFNKWITSFGLFLAAVSVLIAVYVSDSAKKTEAAAGKITREEIQKWVDDQADVKIRELATPIVENRVETFLRSKDSEIGEFLRQQKQLIEQTLPGIVGDRQGVEASAVTKDNILMKKQSQRTFHDWNLLYDRYIQEKNNRGALEAAIYLGAVAKTELEKALSIRAEAAAYVEIGDYETAINIYQELRDRYWHETNKEIAELTARSVVDQGIVFDKTSGTEEAINTFTAVIDRYGHDQEIGIVDAVARARFNLGIALRQTMQIERAIEVYSSMLKDYGKYDQARIAAVTVRAQYNLAGLYWKTQNFTDAVLTYKALIEKYQKYSESDIAEVVALASKSLRELESQTPKPKGSEAKA